MTSDRFMKVLQEHVRLKGLREAELIEKTVRESLEATSGVFILRDHEGTLKEVCIHPLVPYLTIYEAREPLAPEFWENVLKNGTENTS